MDLERIVKIVWKWAWLIVLAAGVAGVASYYATQSTPRIYRTSTTIMVGRFIEDPDPDSRDFSVSQQLGQTYAQLARRQPALEGALVALNLAELISWQALRGDVSVSLVPGTQLMDIAVTDTNPQRAKALADAIAQQLILQSPSNPSSDQEERRAFATEQMTDLETNISEAEAEIEELQNELDEAVSARLIQDLESQINALQDRVSTWQSSYAQFLTFLQGGEVNYLAVVEEASVPINPIAPNVSMNILLAVTIGASLAVVAALLLDFIDDTVKSSEDIERLSPLTMLGSIGRIDGSDRDSLPIAVRLPNALVVEDYRTLRTNLQLSSGFLSRSLQGKPARTLVVTSSDRLEGKSTTACNLATVMAQSGLRTILVDADLRRPMLHRRFQLPRVGLTEALLKSHPFEGNQPIDAAVVEFLQETSVGNLRVMTSGHLPPNPADLLGSTQMSQMIRALEEEADVVIFDTPPAAVVTDAVVLASQVDGIVLVVNHGSTRRAMFQRTVEALERAGTPILGVVLNRVSGRGNGYYGRPYAVDERRNAGRQKGIVARIPLIGFLVSRSKAGSNDRKMNNG